MKKGIFLLVIFAIAQLLHAQQAARGILGRVQQLTGGTDSVGRQYAVIVAIDRYRYWNALRNPVKDAQEIKEILSRRYYIDEFVELYDQEATKAGIIRLFEKLISLSRPQDSVLIFYAGHGHLDKLSDTGFWIPVDGGLDRYEQLNWLPNTQIRGFISKMKARHVLLISDSCFSGDILNPTRSISPEITSEYFRKAYARASRQVLTSGASESVPDQSPFTRGLKMALEGNTSPYLDPLMLYGEIRLGVQGTTPLFGDLKDCGHQEGASFLLFLREERPPPVKPTFKLERTYGVLEVESKVTARLFLDEVFQGEVPVGAIARIENVATGSHLVEVLYENGGYESREVTVERDTETRVSFAPEPEPEKPAEPEPTEPPEELKPLANLAPLPVVTIKIDGKLEDWKGVPPAFVDEVRDRGGMDIERVFLAKDAKYLYMRMDIADQSPTNWMRPHNFDPRHWAHYAVGVHYDSSHWIDFSVNFADYEKPPCWQCRVGKGNGKWWELIDDKLCSFRMKGSSMEARFALSSMRKYLVENKAYLVDCITGYSDRNDKWVMVDNTFGKMLTF